LIRLIAVYEMYNVKIISLEAPFTYEFYGMLCISCMSYYCSNMWSKLVSKNALVPVYMDRGSI
jgi:hypothetical protein